jgi:hypothetical protein
MLRRLGSKRQLTLHDMELPRIAGAHPYVSYIPRLDDIVEGLHCLLDGRVGVEAVTLKKIDVIQLKPLERSFHRVEYMLYTTFVVVPCVFQIWWRYGPSGSDHVG